MRKIFELAALGILLWHFFAILQVYSQLPDQVPTHFNALGEADSFGSKVTLWYIFAISLVLYLAISAFNFDPLKSKLPASFHKAQVPIKNLPIALELMCLLKLFVVSILFLTCYHTLETIAGNSVNWFVPVIIISALALPLFIIFIYYPRLYK